MPQDFSEDGYSAIFSLETDKVLVTLLEIIVFDDAGGVVENIYVCNNNESVTHAGDEYEPFPFSIDLPDDIQGAVPTAVLEIDNVDQSILTALSEAVVAPVIKATLVLAGSPEQIELPTMEFTLRDVKFDQEVITGTLTQGVAGDEPFPGLNFNMKDFPKLFTKPDPTAAA